jgi:hypothetical protein
MSDVGFIRDLPEVNFILEGHDCPLGFYPSVIVPVGRLGSERVVLFSSDNGPKFQVVSPDKQYVEHHGSTVELLSEFDALRHGLFAVSSEEILIYELGRESDFYRKILGSAIAFGLDTFYRLSLSFETNDSKLIRRTFDICKRQLDRTVPEVVTSWISAVMADHGDVLQSADRRQEEQQIERRAASGAKGASAPTRRRMDYEVSPEMNRESTGAAVAELTNHFWSRRRHNDQLSLALLTSLGSFLYRPMLSDPLLADSEVPSPVTVVRESGFTLQFLEFNNVILNRQTALTFLTIAQSGLPQTYIRQTLLTTPSYLQVFARPVVKIGRRILFTYAEVLRLTGYSDGVMARLMNP